MPIEGTNDTYSAGGVTGFLGDLARHAYDPIADITPGVGELRAASRGGDFAHEAVQQWKQGNVGEATKYGLGSLGEYATTVPGLAEIGGAAKVATAGLMKSAPLIGGMFVGAKSSLSHTMVEAMDALKALKEGDREANAKLKAETGWFRDVAGHIQREIPDTNATVSDEFATNAAAWSDPDLAKTLYKAGKNKDEFTLGEVLHHPGLYEAYPDPMLKDIKVILKPGKDDNSFGAFNPGKSSFKDGIDPDATIILNPRALRNMAKKTGIPFKDAFTSTLLHEVQHLIQYKENWPLGGSPEFFDIFYDPAFRSRVKKDIMRAKQELKTGKGFEDTAAYLNHLHKIDNYITSLHMQGKPEGGDLYWGLLGEQQARETAERFMRSKNPRWSSKVYNTLPRHADPVRVIKPYTSMKEDEYLMDFNPSLHM